MEQLTSKEIRSKWIEFFESKDHLKLESASLIPHNDPTLLWINSGVATLKDFFSGKKKPQNARMVNSQKSIRTNDIDNVGNTSRHHTFFEMLGNFSIGDYFKDEALEYALEFLTKILAMPLDKIYITYYKEDKATYHKWITLGIEADHLIKGDKEMNFWDLGQGPCGPDTEIFFDRGDKFDARGVELIAKDLENDRYIEIWNIVFSQLNNDGENNYTELSQKNIDTGAGLERITCIMQDVPTNFETDLFMPIIKGVEIMSKYKYDANNYFTKNKEQAVINKSFRVIADHMRAVVNAINDGAKPSNISRGYIIRRLIRRAYRSGMKLGIKDTTFLFKLVQVIKDSLIFDINVNKVSEIIKKEELAFAKTVEQGGELLTKSIVPNQPFAFAVAFKLFETYGFPIELTQEMLLEKGIKLDISKFDEFKKAHANASRGKVIKGMSKQVSSLNTIKEHASTFVGYEQTSVKANVLYLLNEEKQVEHLKGLGYVVFDQTPFYATSGGQRHDKGFIKQNKELIEVIDVFKDKYNNHIHQIKGTLEKGPVELIVDEEIRLGLERNHSGTHLLFNALREVLGSHIKQLGSDNNEERLTFDFPNESKPTEMQIEAIENLMQRYIKMDSQREYIQTTIKKAEAMGAIMTLEEQEYMDPKNVRIVKFPNITTDLCGGTHLSNTKELENFKIVTVENKGSGIYRIKAISSNVLVNEYLKNEIIKYTQSLSKVIIKNKVLDKYYELGIDSSSDLSKTLKSIKSSIVIGRTDNKQLQKSKTKVSSDLESIKLSKIKDLFFCIDLEVSNVGSIKNTAIALREKYPEAIFVIGAKTDKQLLIVASKEHSSNEIIQKIFKLHNGSGGGSKILAQGACDQSKDLLKDIQKIVGTYA